jgi:hypothetical protein
MLQFESGHFIFASVLYKKGNVNTLLYINSNDYASTNYVYTAPHSEKGYPSTSSPYKSYHRHQYLPRRSNSLSLTGFVYCIDCCIKSGVNFTILFQINNHQFPHTRTTPNATSLTYHQDHAYQPLIPITNIRSRNHRYIQNSRCDFHRLQSMDVHILRRLHRSEKWSSVSNAPIGRVRQVFVHVSTAVDNIVTYYSLPFPTLLTYQ